MSTYQALTLLVGHIVHTNKSLAWLPSERLYQQPTETDAGTLVNHWVKVRDQYRRVRGRTEGAEGDCNPIGRTTVSTNGDPSELSETKPKTKEHTWAGSWPQAHV